MQRIALLLMCFVSARAALAEPGSPAPTTRPATSPSTAPNAQSLSVSLLPVEFVKYDGYSVKVRFTNNGTEDLTIFRRLDGSDYGWFMPHYHFRVFAEDNSELKLGSRCGNAGLWSKTTWPNSYAITLAPGTSIEMKLRPPQIEKPGTYRIQFSYIYRVDEDQQRRFPTPANAWIGESTAPERAFTFQSQLGGGGRE